jgi:hypothetical protein
MCNLYSITTNQDAIIRLFRVINRYVGNLAPMPGVFPDYPAPATQWLLNPISGRSLPKTGIFAAAAGDFQRTGLSFPGTGSLETGP